MPLSKQERSEPGAEPSVVGDHARSFAWLMLIIGIFLWTLVGVPGVLVDLLPGNPDKLPPDAAVLATSLIAVFLIATLGLSLIFGISQSVVAAVATVLAKRYGRSTQALTLLLVPAVAVLTWYCFDDLTQALVRGPDYVFYTQGGPSRITRRSRCYRQRSRSSRSAIRRPQREGSRDGCHSRVAPWPSLPGPELRPFARIPFGCGKSQPIRPSTGVS